VGLSGLMSTPVDTSDDTAATSPPAPSRERVEVTIIEPSRGWRLINVHELWRFRELLFFLAWRDVKVRYKQTLLGVAWAVLQPAMMMVVLTFVFGRMGGLEKSGNLAYPYSLFVLAGLLPWTFFATAIANGANSLVGSERLITKIYFPRLVVPFAAVGAAVVDVLIACILLFGMMVWNYDTIEWGWNLLLAVPILGVIILAALGVGTLLAALNVAYRDFRHVVPFLVQVWMFATPSIYLPAARRGTGPIHQLLVLNPMDALIGAFRCACLGESMGPEQWGRLGIATALAATAFLAGCLCFRRMEDGFADII
jgi:lipopolysaccharide transport system permease protein